MRFLSIKITGLRKINGKLVIFAVFQGYPENCWNYLNFEMPEVQYNIQYFLIIALPRIYFHLRLLLLQRVFPTMYTICTVVQLSQINFIITENKYVPTFIQSIFNINYITLYYILFFYFIDCNWNFELEKFIVFVLLIFTKTVFYFLFYL